MLTIRAGAESYDSPLRRREGPRSADTKHGANAEARRLESDAPDVACAGVPSCLSCALQSECEAVTPARLLLIADCVQLGRSVVMFEQKIRPLA